MFDDFAKMQEYLRANSPSFAEFNVRKGLSLISFYEAVCQSSGRKYNLCKKINVASEPSSRNEPI